MKRPVEYNYQSQVAYTRALEQYCDSLIARIVDLETQLDAVKTVQKSCDMAMHEKCPEREYK